MKIYTRTGDQGETTLLGGARVPKAHLRIETYGTVDELNSALGLVRSFRLDDGIDALLDRVQSELLQLGADLATPLGVEVKGVVRIADGQVGALEREIDGFDSELPALRQFILPGGTPAGAALHLARTICRRAERLTVQCATQEDCNPTALRYLNRLSDWLFTLARLVNHRAGRAEPLWRAPQTPSRT